MKIFFRILKYVSLALISIVGLLFLLWCIGILVYAPLPKWFTVSAGIVLAVLVALIIFVRRYYTLWGACLSLCLVTITVVFITIKPSNDRDWLPEYQRLPFIVWSDDYSSFSVFNMRDFLFRTSDDYDVKYVDKKYKMSDFKGMYYLIVYFDSPLGNSIGHSMLGFQFGKDIFFISSETRRDANSQFGAIPDLYKQDGLIYILGTASDLLGVRTNARQPEEHVYMFKTVADKKHAYNLLRFFSMRLGSLRNKPEFYNTVVSNCLLSLIPILRTKDVDLPFWHTAYLFNGYSPNLAYEKGFLQLNSPDESYESLKKRSYINERTRKWDHKRETYLPLILKEEKSWGFLLIP